MTPVASRWVALCAAALAVFSVGCGHEYDADLTVLSDPPRSVEVSSRSLAIDEGLAVAVEAIPIEDDERMDWDTLVEVQSLDQSVLEVHRLAYDEAKERAKDDEEDREGDWRFMLYARAAGTTTLLVTVGDDGELDVPVAVTTPPE